MGDNILLRVTEWQNQRRVDVRQFDGANFPTKKGVSLTPSRFKALMNSLDQVTSSLQDVIEGKKVNFERHLGNNIWIYVTSPYLCVQIRKKYMHTNGDLQCSTFGVSLKRHQWSELCKYVEVIDNTFEDLRSAQTCSESHQDALASLMCPECTPYLLGDQNIVSMN